MSIGDIFYNMLRYMPVYRCHESIYSYRTYFSVAYGAKAFFVLTCCHMALYKKVTLDLI